jgi:hypothetical protein
LTSNNVNFTFGADASKFIRELEKMIRGLEQLAIAGDKAGDFDLAARALRGAKSQDPAIRRRIEELQRLQDQLKETEDLERRQRRVRPEQTSDDLKRRTQALREQERAAKALRAELGLVRAEQAEIRANLARRYGPRDESGSFTKRQPLKDRQKDLNLEAARLRTQIAKNVADQVTRNEQIVALTEREAALNNEIANATGAKRAALEAEVLALKQAIRQEIDATNASTAAEQDRLSGVTRELSAQEKFAERVSKAFSDGAITQALDQRRKALEDISDTLVDQIQQLETAALASRGDDSGQAARAQAAAAKRRVAAVREELRAREKVEALEKQQAARAGANISRNRQLSLDLGKLSAGQLPSGVVTADQPPRDPAAEQELAAAYAAQAAAKKELVAAEEQERAAQATVDRAAQTSGQAAAINDLKARLAEVIRLRLQLGSDEGISAATGTVQQLTQAYDSLQEALSRGNLSTEEFKAKQAELGRLLAQNESELKKLGEARDAPQALDSKGLNREIKKSTGFFTRTIQNAALEFGRRFRTTLQFAISGAILFGAQRLVREFFQAAIEVERAFADIESALVFDIDAERGTTEFTKQTEVVRQRVLALANEFNVLPTEANKAAFEMIARFQDIDNAMVALRAQLLATKIATIDMSEALRSLTATGEGFVQVQDFLVPGLDLQGRLMLREAAAAQIYERALNNAVVIQQNWGLAVEDTIEASGRAAPILGNLGFSLEQTNALIAAVAKGLGIPGSQAVEKLNRAFSRITDPEVRDDLLEIAKANEAFVLSFGDFQGAEAGANVYEKILEQADEIRALDPNTFTEIVKAIGGDREAEIVFTALSTGDVQRDALNRFDDAAGQAEERFKFLAVTISETIASLIAGFQELAQNFERLGLIFPLAVFLKGVDLLIEGLNNTLKVMILLVKWVDGFSKGLGTGIIRVTSLAASLASVLFIVKAIASASAFGTLGNLVTSIQGTAGVSGVLARTFGTRIAAGAAAGQAAGGGTAGIAAFLAALTPLSAKMILLGGAIGGVVVAAGVVANGFFQMREDQKRFNETLQEFSDNVDQRALLGPEPGETQAEFALRNAGITLEQIDLLDRANTASSVEQAGDILREILEGDFSPFPEFTSNREFREDWIDFLRNIASSTQVREQVSTVGAGLRGLPARLSEPQTQRAIRISQDRINVDRLLQEAETPEDYAEVVRLSQANFDDMLGLQRELEAQALQFAESLRSIDKNIAQARSQRAVGDISAAELTAILQEQLANARRILAEDPGNQEAQQKILDIRKQIIDDQTAAFDRLRAQNSVIASETDRLEADLRVAAAELAQFFVSFGATAEQFGDLIRAWVTAARALVDAVQAEQVALAQARLGSARNVSQFAARSKALAAALRKQADTLENDRGDEVGAELKRIEAAEVEFTAQQRVFADRTNLLVQKRIAAGKVNDQLAAAEGELIRIGRELQNQYLSEAERQELLNEQRRTRAQIQSILLARYRAATELAAGTNDEMLRLKAELSILARELEHAAKTQTEQSVEWARLKLAQKQAQDELINAMLELEDLNRRLDTDITNDLAQAELDLVEILRKLQIPDLGELEKARLELERRNAEAQLQQAFFDDRLFQLRFQFETGELGTSAYVAALRRLQEEVDLSTQQGMEIFLQIEGIINGLTDGLNNMAFNIPTSIRLPTLLEVRRSLAADQLGVNYQDNRTIYVTLDISSTVDLEEALAVIENAFGSADAAQGLASAPGQFAFTIGGF